MYSFPLGENEHVLKKGMASLHIDADAFSGALYLTDERLVYVGYMMDITRKYMEEIPLEHIGEAKAGKTFYVIPNVINIVTIKGRRLKVIVEKRNEWLAAIQERIEKLG